MEGRERGSEERRYGQKSQAGWHLLIESAPSLATKSPLSPPSHLVEDEVKTGVEVRGKHQQPELAIILTLPPPPPSSPANQFAPISQTSSGSSRLLPPQGEFQAVAERFARKMVLADAQRPVSRRRRDSSAACRA